MLSEIALLVIQPAYWVLISSLFLRAWFYFQGIPLQYPLGPFIRSVSDWGVLPLRYWFPLSQPKYLGDKPWWRRLDWASFILALGIQILYAVLSLWLEESWALILSIPLWWWPGKILIGLLASSISFLILILLLYTVMSWIQSPAQGENPLFTAFSGLLIPILRPIRRMMPYLGGVDLSPLVLFILCQIGLLLMQSLSAWWLRFSFY